MRLIHAVPLAFSVMLPLLGTVALAQQQQPQQQQENGTAAERMACTADYQKFCAGVSPGDGRALACLSKQKAKLSPACRAVIDKRGG
jgi:hypothetical protein